MIGFSAVFIGVAWGCVDFLQMGANGFVVANIVNLVLRAGVSMRFAKREFGGLKRDWVPDWKVWVGFGLSTGVCWRSMEWFGQGIPGTAGHVFVGLVMFISTGCYVYVLSDFLM
jgi:hypothetical protein